MKTLKGYVGSALLLGSMLCSSAYATSDPALVTAAMQLKMPPDQVLSALKQGNQRYM